MPAAPFAFTEAQPDGFEVHLHLEGDEFFHRLCDTRGFTVVRDRAWFVYARKDAEGQLVPTGLRVGRDDPGKAGLSPNLLPDTAIRNVRRQAMAEIQQAGGSAGEGGAAAAPVSGSLRNLVVLLRFANHATRTVPSQADIDVLMNAPGGHASLAPTGSVRDCYLENSYGQLAIDSTIAYWVTLPNTEAYYANGNSGLTTRTHEALRFALDVLDADPNVRFSDFDHDNDGNIDAITFLHSGYGAEWGGTSSDGAYYTDRIWSHKWAISGGWLSSDGVRVYNYHISPGIWGTSGTAIGRIGVICHETGHFLGLPDLYDGNDSDGDGRSGSGIGSYGLMANSWGFDGSQLHPPHLSVWSKTQLGWMNPTVIDTAGTYALTQAESSPQAYRIDLGYATGEYLLVENRQPVGFDAAMPQGGLCVFHVDEAAGTTTEGFPGQSGWPANGNHYRIALLQADGAYDLERGLDRGDRYDVYHGGGVAEIGPATVPSTDGYQGGDIVVTNNRIFNVSASASTMNFAFEVVGAGQPPAAPSDLAATAGSDSRIDLSWTDNSDNETSFRIERSTDGSTWGEVASVGANVTGHADTGLPAGTTFLYRVIAANGAGPSDPSNVTSATTDPPPPPPAAPSDLAATALSDTAIELTWVDRSDNEDGFLVDRSLDTVIWEAGIASLPPNATSHVDTGLSASTPHYYRVRSWNAQGDAASAVVTATTEDPPPFEDALAAADWFVSGTVTGTYLDTHAAGEGRTEVIEEIESGGRPTRRHSFLDHRWRFPGVRGGLLVSLFVDAWAPANGEGDDFEFQFSTDGGANWASFDPPLVVSNGSSPGSLQVAVFPDQTRGDIDLRIIDTDGTSGNRQLDRVLVDQLFIRTDLDATDFPPAAPDLVTASVVSPTEIDLSWRDNAANERGFEVWRSTDGIIWDAVGSAAIDANSFTDVTATPATTYQFRVSAFTLSFESFSNPSDPVTTPDGLSLDSLSGGKRKGAIYVDLAWSGGASLGAVDVWRSENGGPFVKVITGTPNDGTERDESGLKGGQVLTYEIRSPDGSIISNAGTITF